MAKGRKLTERSRRERLLGTNRTTSRTRTDMCTSSEFGEEEVWSTTEEKDVREREYGQRHVGGLSIAFDRMDMVLSSSPVNVPLKEDDQIHHHSDMVPPHEYLARSRNIASNSVFEGLGRTLKGRDLRRLRDAVWSHTGFDG